MLWQIIPGGTCTSAICLIKSSSSGKRCVQINISDRLNKSQFYIYSRSSHFIKPIYLTSDRKRLIDVLQMSKHSKQTSDENTHIKCLCDVGYVLSCLSHCDLILNRFMISDLLQYKDILAMSLKHFNLFTIIRSPTSKSTIVLSYCTDLLVTMCYLFWAGLFLGVSVVNTLILSSPVLSLYCTTIMPGVGEDRESRKVSPSWWKG